MTIGILGGSFNPVHIGHLMLASYLSQFGGLDEVWLTLSPLNPLKVGSDELIPDLTRLKMLEIATGDTRGLNVCDYELAMPKPSYTINTLRYLAKRYPRHSFKLIIGSDNWKIFNQWKDHESILSDFGVIVYPRPGYPVGTIYEDGVDVVNAPTANISSTFLRKAIAKGLDMKYFLPPGVFEYIKENKLYGA
ncbi:MAG: nicotinate-nucleotide adenylyltransferase [Bacteroides sp.]|nr:nicotinate-nucleotide adenylyltransferase [Bacteroides sp.]MBD5353347.1 nicotinate-nucleotide adenylyltransferase [Bacteroides sp.]MDE6813174.1 nicotinate-nucleotide adenylyltransferase [Duncaniella sp.]MDE6824000.1 nicotinate-nucleotide adenylyltransferase [Duncaniella sp.]